MPALSTLDKIVVSSTGNVADAAPVDWRVLHMRMLSDLGYTAFVISNTAPADQTALWWHKDIKAAKRYSATVGNWVTLTAGQFSLYLARRMFAEAVNDVTVENDDLFLFWDTSLKESKDINTKDLANKIVSLWHVSDRMHSDMYFFGNF